MEKRLKELEQRRGFLIERRRKEKVKTIALVGYTNTGKSTLMNHLTGADVYVKNELFATLDPTARSFKIADVDFLLIDTVGFLQALPHDLIKAFQSTLESALNCDLALIVCDGTGDFQMQLDTTLKTLEDLKFNLYHYLAMIGNCLDTLEIKKNKGIIENVVYFGLNRKTEEIVYQTDPDKRI